MIAALLFGPVPARSYCIGGEPTLPDYDPHYDSVDAELRRAKYVIRAKVLRESWLGELVIFVTEETFDAPIGRALTLDTCGNPRATAKGAYVLSKLRKLASAKRSEVVGRVGVEPTTY